MPEPPRLLALVDGGRRAVFRYLPHDAAAFGVPCYGFAEAVPEERAAGLAEAGTGPAFFSMKVASPDLPGWREFLARRGFAFVDTELVLSGRLDPALGAAPAAGVEYSRDPGLARRLCPELFADLPSRFHMDPRIGRDRAGAFWHRYLLDMLEKDTGWAVFPLLRGRPVGVCLFVRQAARLVIQLVALEPGSRGRGIAAGILAHAASATGLREAGTEVYAAGGRSLNWYLKNGLTRVEAVSHVFHRWTGAAAAGENVRPAPPEGA